jgi:hypothetical protein
MSEAASMAGRDARGDESARDARGRFEPGVSGNPAGKQPGTRNLATRFRLLLEDGDFEAAGRLIIQKARAGNLAAARFIIDHVDPKPRGRAIALDVASDASLVERYAALTRAMLAGEVSPQEAAAMARLLEREAALRAAVRQPAAARQPAPAPARDLHPACSPGRDEPAAPWQPDRLGAVSRSALMAGWPASDLHPPIARAAAASAVP